MSSSNFFTIFIAFIGFILILPLAFYPLFIVIKGVFGGLLQLIRNLFD